MTSHIESSASASADMSRTAELQALASSGDQPGWRVLDVASAQQFTGEITFRVQPLTSVYFDGGAAYYAVRAGDPSLCDGLLEGGVLTPAQIERGVVRVGNVENLGRLFDRDPSVDRDAVMVVVEMATDDVVAAIANNVSGPITVMAYRHHVSGVHRWFVSPGAAGEQPAQLAPVGEVAQIDDSVTGDLPSLPTAADHDAVQIEWDQPLEHRADAVAPTHSVDGDLLSQLLGESERLASTAEATAPAPTPAPTPVPQPVVEPAPEPVPQPVAEPAPAPQPAPQPVVEPAPAPQPAPQPVVEPAPAPQPAPQPVVEPAPAPQPAPQSVVEPAPAPQPAPQSVVEPAPAPQPAPQSVVEPASAAVPQPVVEPAPAPVPQPVADPAPDSVPQPVAEPEPVPQPVAEPEPVPRSVVEPAPAPQPGPAPTVEPQPARVHEPAPEPVRAFDASVSDLIPAEEELVDDDFKVLWPDGSGQHLPDVDVPSVTDEVRAPEPAAVIEPTPIVDQTPESVAPTAESVAPTAETVVPTAETVAPTAETVAPTAETVAPTAETVAPIPATGAPAESPSMSIEALALAAAADEAVVAPTAAHAPGAPAAAEIPVAEPAVEREVIAPTGDTSNADGAAHSLTFDMPSLAVNADNVPDDEQPEEVVDAVRRALDAIEAAAATPARLPTVATGSLPSFHTAAPLEFDVVDPLAHEPTESPSVMAPSAIPSAVFDVESVMPRAEIATAQPATVATAAPAPDQEVPYEAASLVNPAPAGQDDFVAPSLHDSAEAVYARAAGVEEPGGGPPPGVASVVFVDETPDEGDDRSGALKRLIGSLRRK